MVRNPEPAVAKTPLLSEERKAHIISRWLYWQSVDDSLHKARGHSMQMGE